MKCLLDTCTLIWLCAEPDQLSPLAHEMIDNPRHELLLSEVSVLEISLKWSAGKLGLPSPPRNWVPEQIKQWEIQTLPIETEEMFRSSELPKLHKDPFDRLIVAIAIRHECVLLSPDAAIRQYPVDCRW